MHRGVFGVIGTPSADLLVRMQAAHLPETGAAKPDYERRVVRPPSRGVLKRRSHFQLEHVASDGSGTVNAPGGFEAPETDIRAAIFTHASVRTWEGHGSEGIAFGPAVAPKHALASWEDAARQGYAGVAVHDDGTVLVHGDAPGALPLFVAKYEHMVLFSTSLDGLARSYPGRLSVDHQAWWELLAAAMVLSNRTPFAEISRIAPATAQGVDGSGALVTRHTTRWPDLLESDTGAEQDLIYLIQDTVRRAEADDLIVPLSGGWDSRLLVSAAAEDPRNVITVTAADDRGRHEEETVWAAEVAARLGLPHMVLDPLDNWWQAATDAAFATGYLTSLHHWLTPLAPYAAATGGTVLDGLAAGVLFKNGLVPEGEDDTVASALRGRLAGAVAPTELLTEQLATNIDAHVGGLIDDTWKQVRDHRAGRHLAVLALRTTRGISLAPWSVLAQQVDVVTPALDPDVLALGLSVPLEAKSDGQFYRKVLAALPTPLHDIASSNDTKRQRWTDLQPDLTREVADRTHRLLADPSVRTVLGPALRARASSGRAAAPMNRRHREVVRGLSLFARWASRYQNLLGDVTLIPEVPNPGAASSGSLPAPDPGDAQPVAGDPPAEPLVADQPAVAVDGDPVGPEELPDQPWLPHQIAPITMWLRHEDEVATVSTVETATVGSGQGTGGGEVPRPSRILVTGPFDRLGDLDELLQIATHELSDQGRVIVDLPLGGGRKRPSVLEVCELVASRFDLCHHEVDFGRIRLVCAAGGGNTPPAALIAALIAGLEARERTNRRRIRKLERQTTGKAH